MKVTQIDNANFKAGKINLLRVNADKLSSLDAIKKIAEDKKMDVYISKNNKSRYLPKEDMYMIMVSKNDTLINRGFSLAGKTIKYDMSCFLVNKRITNEELSVRIFNAFMNAAEVLEKKLCKKK